MTTTSRLDSGRSLPRKAAVATILWALAATLALAAPGGKGGKGGGDSGNEEIPVETTFNCPVVQNDNDCRIGVVLSPFQADGVAATSAYSDGVDNVRNRFSSGGQFVLTTHERSNRFGSRTVFWDLSNGQVPITLPTVGAFTSTSEFDGVYDHKTVIQVGKFSGMDLRTMEPGDVLTNVDMILDLVFETSRNSADTIWVRYVDDSATSSTNGQTQCPPGSNANGVTIERTDMGTVGEARAWAIRVDASDIACVYTPADVDNFDTLGASMDSALGPFELYVTEQL